MSEARIKVTVDEDLEELIPGFLENRKNDISALSEALEGGDIAKVQSIGHSIKGVGGGYGFDGLSELGAQLEIAAKESDSVKIGELITEMSQYMDSIDIVYE